MKITVLMEHRATPPLQREHGLSLHITKGETTLLLDGGASGKSIENGEELGLSIENVDFAVLSHGHYDHSDGFRRFFQKNENAPLYLRVEATDSYFSMTSGSPKFVGIHKGFLEEWQERLCWVSQNLTSLGEDLFLIEQPKQSLQMGKNMAQEGLYCVKEGWNQFREDRFYHQQTLVSVEESQLVLCNSCCHGDLRNIVEDVQKRCGKEKGKQKFSLVGGLHLPITSQGEELFSREEVRELGRVLLGLGLERLYTGHCTSEVAFDLLQESLGERISWMRVGEEIEFH